MFKILNMKQLFFTITFILSLTSFGQKKLELKEIDLNRVMKDIVYSDAGDDQISILYWIPDVYWDIMSAKDPRNFNAETVSMIKQLLENKSLFFAVSGKMNSTTHTFDAKEESYLRSNISVTFNGKVYKPMTEAKLSEEMKMLNDYIKPVFSRMLGDMGSGLTLFFFDVNDGNGQNLLNPYSDTDFSVKLCNVNHTLHLPLPCLYSDSKCANDGELFPANYEFCPYHGSKLITQ